MPHLTGKMVCPEPGFPTREGLEILPLLRRYHDRVLCRIREMSRRKDPAPHAPALLKIARDGITRELLGLVEREMAADGFGSAPAAYVWVGLGAEGRAEETLVRRQRNILIYHDRGYGKDGASRYFREFSIRMAEGLTAAGLGKCGNDGILSPEERIGSAGEWEERIDNRLLSGRGPFKYSDMIELADARPVAGDTILFENVFSHLHSSLARADHVMREFVPFAGCLDTALGLFGSFKQEREGKHRGTFRVGAHGWAPLVVSIKAFSLWQNIEETTTLLRIHRLREKGLISDTMKDDLIAAYLAFMNLVLKSQVRSEGAIDEDAIRVNPEKLDAEERESLRHAMRSVENFQNHLCRCFYSETRSKGESGGQ